jgi:uncharacterized membrane protein YdjX (TVP38/TMEM64 family)
MAPADTETSAPSGEYKELHDKEGEEHGHHRCSCKKVMFVLVVVALIALLVIEKDKIAEGLNAFVDWCGKLGPFAIVMMALCIATVTLVGVPSCPLFIGAGVVFVKLYGNVVGTLLGIASACVGVWLGSMLAFVLGRSMLKPMVQKKLEEFKTMVVVNKIIEKEGWKFAFLMRLSPFLPAEVFNYACSVTTMTVAANGLACIGSLPTTAFWVWTSASATDAASSGADAGAQRQRLILFVGINVVVIILMVVLVRSATKKFHTYAEQIEEEEHRELLKRGKGAVMLDIHKASSQHKFYKAVGAVEVSQWAASKLRREKMMTRTSTAMKAAGKFKRSIHRPTTPKGDMGVTPKGSEGP